MPGRRAPASGVAGIEHDLHRDALDDLGEVAGRVVRRQQREFLAAGRREAVDMALDGRAGEHVDVDLDRLAGLHVGELRLLEVRDDIGRVDRHDRHQLRAGLDILADAQRAVADHAVDRRGDRRIGEVELGLVLHRLVVGERWLVPGRDRP